MIPLTAALIFDKQSFRGHVVDALKNIPLRVLLDQGSFGAWHLVREKLERLRPDVVLLDLVEDSSQRFAYVQQIRSLPDPPAVVVFHETADSQLILSAMRAGAAEFLTIPFEAGALESALDRISALLPGRQKETGTGGKLLAFLSVKGGTGATTLACNVAASLGRMGGKEVLLADLDLETGNVAFAMKASSQYSILEACHNISRLDTHYWKGLVSNGLPSLNILTAPPDLRGLDAPQGVEVRQVLRFARSIYAYTVVDLASSLNRLALSVVEDADRTLLITTAELPALHQAKRALQTLLHGGIDANRLALVVNRASRRDEVTEEDIARNLNVPVFWTFPNDTESVTEFYVKGGVIRPQSDLGKSIKQFVQKILGPGTPSLAPPKKMTFLRL